MLESATWILGGRTVSYDRFWPYFLAVHQRRETRWLHAVATVLGLLCALVAFPLTRNTAWIVIGLATAYPIAWLSHYLYERRRPAAFTNPVWALLCDIEMTVLMAV